MPLPALEKTWNHNVNNLQIGGVTTNSGEISQSRANMLYYVKEQLVLWGHVSVLMSGDGLAASGATDLWLDPANLIKGTSPTADCSWIVLDFTSAGFQMLIALRPPFSNDPNRYGNAATIQFTLPSTPFTGGTGGQPPTSTKPQYPSNFANFYNWSIGGENDPEFGWHLMQSSDGLNTRLFMNKSGVIVGAWMFEQLTGPTLTDETHKNYLFLKQNGNAYPPDGNDTVLGMSYAYNLEAHNSNTFFSWANDENRLQHAILSERSLTNTFFGISLTTNPVDNTEVFTPVHIGRVAPENEYRGKIPDLYRVRSTIADTTMFPTAAPFAWAKSGGLAFPWDPTSGAMITA